MIFVKKADTVKLSGGAVTTDEYQIKETEYGIVNTRLNGGLIKIFIHLLLHTAPNQGIAASFSPKFTSSAMDTIALNFLQCNF